MLLIADWLINKCIEEFEHPVSIISCHDVILVAGEDEKTFFSISERIITLLKRLKFL